MTPYDRRRERDRALYEESNLRSPVSRERLLEALGELKDVHEEDGHLCADMFLLRYIGDEEIRAAFLALSRWYA